MMLIGELIEELESLDLSDEVKIDGKEIDYVSQKTWFADIVPVDDEEPEEWTHKYIMTVHPIGDSESFITQAFFTTYIEAESEEDAKEQAIDKGYRVWSICKADSDIGKLIKHLDKRIDDCKTFLDQAEHKYDTVFRAYTSAKHDAYKEIYDIIRCLGIPTKTEEKNK